IIHKIFGTVATRFRPTRSDSRLDAEPSPTEPSRAEPIRAEPIRAEPSRAEPNGAEPGQVEPSRTEPSRAGRAGRAGLLQNCNGPAAVHPGPKRTDRTGSVRLGSARPSSARLRPARLGSARLGSAPPGSARLGPARLGSAPVAGAFRMPTMPRTRLIPPPGRGIVGMRNAPARARARARVHPPSLFARLHFERSICSPTSPSKTTSSWQAFPFGCFHS
ncbi:hypothetical protein MUK42_18806, partial [Musa troglodytarum]